MADEETRQEDQIKPFRIQINFTGAGTSGELAAISDEAIELGTELGLLFEWGFVCEMDENDIIADSPLEAALKELGYEFNDEQQEEEEVPK